MWLPVSFAFVVSLAMLVSIVCLVSPALFEPQSICWGRAAFAARGRSPCEEIHRGGRAWFAVRLAWQRAQAPSVARCSTIHALQQAQLRHWPARLEFHRRILAGLERAEALVPVCSLRSRVPNCNTRPLPRRTRP